MAGATVVQSRRNPRKTILQTLREHHLGYLLMLPSVLLVFSISIYPVAYALNLSFRKTTYMTVGPYVGLAQYRAFFSDPAAIRAITNSLGYVFLSLLIAVPIGLGLALLLNRPLPGIGVFRTLIIIPWVVAETVTALLWSWLLNPDFGPVNFLLYLLGPYRVEFLANPNLVFYTVVMANIWRSYPLVLILTLAALQTVPDELYEAVMIDGGSGWDSFRRITFPYISNTLMITSILLTLQYFNMVTLHLVLTGGGPLGVAEVLSLFLFKQGFEYWNLGYAATAGVIIFVFNIVFSTFYIYALRRDPF